MLGTLRLCQETNKHATPKPHFLYQTGVIKPQRVTDFQGKRTAGEMSDSQVANARQIAMAGVIGKNDPVTGARMMREVKSAERDDQRFGWEQQRAERDG